jgi:hypothetical protein
MSGGGGGVDGDDFGVWVSRTRCRVGLGVLGDRSMQRTSRARGRKSLYEFGVGVSFVSFDSERGKRPHRVSQQHKGTQKRPSQLKSSRSGRERSLEAKGTCIAQETKLGLYPMESTSIYTKRHEAGAWYT